ncbi:MAG: DUF1499 domain-containing protein [Myxococcota bacterium]|nr:DUF1499 domain-containing protein [Myxococcota bacterium]
MLQSYLARAAPIVGLPNPWEVEMHLLVLLSALAGCGGTPPGPIAKPDGPTLPVCPASRNCLSSQADPRDAEHHTDPLAIHGDPASAIARLATIIDAHARTTVTYQSPTALRATYTSRIFRFIDDVELRLDVEQGVVHVRSASRVGYDDLGANPRRVSKIRSDWEAAR